MFKCFAIAVWNDIKYLATLVSKINSKLNISDYFDKVDPDCFSVPATTPSTPTMPTVAVQLKWRSEDNMSKLQELFSFVQVKIKFFRRILIYLPNTYSMSECLKLSSLTIHKQLIESIQKDFLYLHFTFTLMFWNAFEMLLKCFWNAFTSKCYLRFHNFIT